ncbi:MAG TPA: hypothetical protein VLZ29_03440 [Sulfurimonas sp.]|uniref:hypothetical protein n=1 Tax=Sulfurimonas sp. TaxID=2022749 RepID=UPI002C93886D|nr:hypothetical protein [Sulfurimonas sp.]HUH42146.1 hypothetical protein [Sulfurimonas sp.]
MGWFNFLLPIAIEVLKSYINSTSTKSDDRVLEVVKVGAGYLANKSNNDITNIEALNFSKKQIVK